MRKLHGVDLAMVAMRAYQHGQTYDHFKERPVGEEARTKLLFEGSSDVQDEWLVEAKKVQERRNKGEKLVALKPNAKIFDDEWFKPMLALYKR